MIVYCNGGKLASIENVFLTFFILIFIFLSPSVLAVDTTVQSVRVGLTPDYTRITLESNQPLEYELSMLENPHRVIIDLSRTKLSQALATLPQKVDAIDPFVQKIRVGQFTPHVIRLVFDLKSNVVPRTFVIEPKENFAHRLVLDIYHPDKATKADLNARINPAATADFENDVLDELVATLVQNSNKQKTNQMPLIRPHSSKPQLNPASSYHLAFNIGYPNAYDRSLKRTGSLIMVHGSNVSIGCFAMTDPVIEEIYLIVETALNAGQDRVPVHVFPFRMTEERITAAESANAEWLGFWGNLKEGHDLFEAHKSPPAVSVEAGKYSFRP